MFPVVKSPVHGHLYACHQRLPSYYTDSHITQTVIGHSGLHFPCSISLITFIPAANYTHYKNQSQTTIQCQVLFSVYCSPCDSDFTEPSLSRLSSLSCHIISCSLPGFSCLDPSLCISILCFPAYSGFSLFWITPVVTPCLDTVFSSSGLELVCWISHLPRPLDYICPRLTHPCLWITLRLASAISVCWCSTPACLGHVFQ